MADAEIVVGIRGEVGGGKVVQRTLDDVAASGKKATSGQKELETQLRATDAVGKQLANTLKTIVAAFGLRELQQTVDTYTNVQNRLKLVTTSSAELAAVTNDLFTISNQTRQSFESTAEVYARVALATKDMGLSSAQTLQFTESLNQAVALSGASATEAAAGMIQLSQGLASGTLRGDELRSVLEQLPAVADVIAQGLGVTRGELRKMGEDGQITAATVISAFAKAREELDGKFAKTVPTIGQAFVVLKNYVIQFIGSLDQATGASGIVARALITVGQNVDTVAKLVLVAAAAWGAYQLAALSATGATILAAVAGNIVAFVQLAATVRSLAGATALLNATFMAGPGALVAAMAAVVAGAVVFHTQIENFLIKPIAELIILVDKAAAGLNRLFGGEGKNLTGRTAEEWRGAAQDAIDRSKPADPTSAMADAGANSQAELEKLLAGFQGGGSGKKAKLTDEQKELKNLIKETSTEQETLLAKIKELEKLKGFAKTSEELEAVNRGLEVANKQLETASTTIPGMDDGLDRLVKQTDKFAESAADAFGSFVNGSKTAKEALSSLVNDIQKMFFQEAVTNPLSDALRGIFKGAASSASGGSGGGFLGSIFGSIGTSIKSAFGFDSGGSMILGGAGGIDQNTLALNGSPIAKVGRGEVLSISPNERGGGSGVTVYQTIQVSTGVAETVAQEFMAMMPKIQEATKAAINEDRLRGIN